jgi:hypothetical protein
MNYNNLFKKIDLFHKIATDGNIDSIKSAISQEIVGGITAINTLLSKEIDAAKSTAVQTIDDLFGKLSLLINKLTFDNLKYSLPEIESIITQMDFFILPSNAGIGYEPILYVGGEKSPAAYIKRIKSYTDQLNHFLSK